MRAIPSILIAISIGLFPVHSYAADSISKDEFLKRVFSSSERIEIKEIRLTPDKKEAIEIRLKKRVAEDSFTFYIGKTKERVDGYCLILSEKGRHGPIRFITAIDKEARIKDIAVLESREIKGAKIARRRFLRQFIGKGSTEPIRLWKDIDSVTGATISSKAAARAARKALVVWEELFKP